MRRTIILAGLLAATATRAAPPGTIDAPGRITPTGPIATTPVATIAPSLDILAVEVTRLAERLKATEARLAAAEAAMAEQQKSFTFLTVVVNGLDHRLLTHQHSYTYETTDYRNVNVVTEGRPLVKQEKKDYVSFIAGLHRRDGTTTPPLPPTD